jgi:hypothetical protein
MNWHNYTDLLNEVLIPFLDEEMELNEIFPQHNASIHISGHFIAWFAEKKSAIELASTLF